MTAVMPGDSCRLDISTGLHPFLNDLNVTARREDRIPSIGREKEIGVSMNDVFLYQK